MKNSLFVIVLLFVSKSLLWAQSYGSFSVRAGYLQSNTKVSITNPLLIGIAPIKDKPGFYLGIAYQHPLSTLLTTQVELNFQQKGQRVLTGAFQEVVETATYNYIGVTPIIGVKPFQNLSVLLGPELNMLIKQSTPWQRSRPFELGVVVRAQYQISRIGLTGGYFRGLTVYDRSMTETFSFTNQNWQVGLTYMMSKHD